MGLSEWRKRRLEKRLVKIGVTNPALLKEITKEREQASLGKRIKGMFSKNNLKITLMLLKNRKEANKRYKDYLFWKELKKRGYGEEVILELLKHPEKERRKILEKMRIRSVKIPRIGYRVTYSEYAEKEKGEGIKPKVFKLLSTKTPETIFLFVPEKTAREFTDKKAQKRFKRGYRSFVRKQKKIRVEDSATIDGIIAYATRKQDLETKLKIEKKARQKGMKKMSILDYLRELRKVIEKEKDVSIQLVDLEELKKQFEKEGRELVLVNDPEAKDSFMLFEKKNKKLVPVGIPPNVIKTVDLGKPRIEAATEMKKKIEEAYVEELIKKMIEEDVKKATKPKK